MDWGDRIETKGSCWVSQKFRSESVFVSSLGHGEEEERKKKQARHCFAEKNENLKPPKTKNLKSRHILLITTQ